MKLPINKIPAKFQDMKLPSIKPGVMPINRLSQKLLKSRLLKPVAKSLSVSDSGKPAQSIAEMEASKGTKLFLNLLLVRPWVLVLGFWLLAMAIGSVALDGMLSPRKLKMALPEPAAPETLVPKTSSLISVAQSAEELAADGAAADEAESDAPGESASELGDDATSVESGRDSGLPLLPLAVLVGTCAAGSLAISRRRAVMRMAVARAQGRSHQSRLKVSANGRPKVSAKSVKGKTPKVTVAGASMRSAQPAQRKAGRLANNGKTVPFNVMAKRSSASRLKLKKQRQRVKQSETAAARQNGHSSRVLASRTNAQKTAASAPAQSSPQSTRSLRGGRPSRRQVRRASVRAASRRQPMVSVVPANESHALDWNRGSLAHQLDVRPQRSAM